LIYLINQNQISSSKIIANTLLELYIKDSATKKDHATVKGQLTLKEKKVLEFLTNNSSSYDVNLALIICQLHNFRVNIIFII
jgi:vacuolar protein sorting-associated protein 11